MSARHLGWCFALLIVVSSVSAGSGVAPRSIGPSHIVMDNLRAFGAPERPAVEFDHGTHVDALQAEGCTGCHPVEDGQLLPKLTGIHDSEDRDELLDAFHSRCMGCHEERTGEALSSGPVTCGECHVRRPDGISERVPMRFDYSLHARHAQAYPEKCEECHHVYDEELQKLVYVKGEEDACRSCHGLSNEGEKPSLANAVHRGCISCHLHRMEADLDAGPVRCVGCHDLDHQLAVVQLDESEIPRLMRGQPDTTWILDDGARTRVVAFDHKGHEMVTSSCSSCHHRTMRPCGECHSLAGSPEGDGVTMERAHHHARSQYSCVGCHNLNTREPECAGCHVQPSAAPADRTCAVCHSGPPAAPEVAELPPPDRVVPVLAPLPPISESYPEIVEIASLVDRYEASKLPHAKIVARLDAAVRESDLAVGFHRNMETLCVGCHHHSPAATRPPPCRACHAQAAATRDMPGLKVAYHRQCMGCHAAMGIKAMTCTDCHAEREGENS